MLMGFRTRPDNNLFTRLSASTSVPSSLLSSSTSSSEGGGVICVWLTIGASRPSSKTYLCPCVRGDFEIGAGKESLLPVAFRFLSGESFSLPSECFEGVLFIRARDKLGDMNWSATACTHFRQFPIHPSPLCSLFPKATFTSRCLHHSICSPVVTPLVGDGIPIVKPTRPSCFLVRTLLIS